MLITILVPLLLILFIRKEENRLNGFNKTLIFIIKSCSLWFIAYVSMWIAKWTLASIILNINALEYVKDDAMLRINGLQGLKTKKELYFGAIYNNWHNLYPINIVKRKSYLIAIFIVSILVITALFDWKNIKKKWLCGILLAFAITPYIRYLILANHSYRHAFFTFRTQIITIMALGMIIIDGFNYKLWFKNVELKRGKNGRNRTNNINAMLK